jgi:hypothetical protein
MMADNDANDKAPEELSPKQAAKLSQNRTTGPIVQEPPIPRGAPKTPEERAALMAHEAAMSNLPASEADREAAMQRAALMAREAAGGTVTEDEMLDTMKSSDK